MRYLWLLLLPALVYQCLSIVAALGFLARSRRTLLPAMRPGISVLKPLRGLDPNTSEAFVSQVQQDYPEYEVLFGARDADDPAALEVKRLQQQFPNAPIRLITGFSAGSPDAPNGKVGLLMELSAHARYPLRVVNDSDIRVTPEYLAAVTAPLARNDIGVVTCLYHVKAHNIPAAWEALGIATDFMPSTLVAQLVGVREFGMGSTLAFRAADLESVGGFAAFADYIADDYQLAKRITGLGKRTLLSSYTVETSLGDATWSGIWAHQLRWARTIRITKGAAYLGLPVSQTGLWILIALLLGKALGMWTPALVLAAVRILAAFLAAAFVLANRQAVTLCWLAPAWDLYSFAIWVASYAGSKVRWRDRLLEIDREGRIIRSGNV